jgi:hypothetical protein
MPRAIVKVKRFAAKPSPRTLTMRAPIGSPRSAQRPSVAVNARSDAP